MVDAPDLKSVVRIGRGSSSLPLGTKTKYLEFGKIKVSNGDVAKWLTQWFAKPPFMGSNPIVASNKTYCPLTLL